MPKEIIVKIDEYFTSRRKLTGVNYILVVGIGVAMSLFHLYTAGFGLFEAILQRSIHLSFALALAFLLYPFRKGKIQNTIPIIDYILAFVSAGSAAYIPIFYQELVLRAGYLTTIDFIMGLILIISVFEAARRVIGMILPSVCLIIFLYTYFGRYIPGYFGHRGFSVLSIVRHMYYSTEGIFGIALGVTSSFIFLFILFGVVLGETGTGQVFIDLSLALFGRSKGGAAKTAVVASSLFGTINGSSVANVMGTGLFTIPLMKKTGYKDYFAGAVEATASTGGQIMPPIMGAGAFIMAEFLGISYLKVAIAAFIPAVLYYVGTFSMVHLEANRLGLKAMRKEDLPKLKNILLKRGYLLLPIVILLYYLFNGYTPTKAAYFAILTSLVIAIFNKTKRMSISKIIYILSEGAFNALELATACAVIGFIIGTASLTGLAIKISNLVVIVSEGNFLLALMLTHVVCIFLGMAIPTTAKYIMVSMMVAPALVLMDIPGIAAHLFIFYFAILSDLTPPVALTAMAAAGVARSDFYKTAFTAVKLALAGFIVPYLFVYSPKLLLGFSPFNFGTMMAIILAIISIYFLGAAMINWAFSTMNIIQRMMTFSGAILLITAKLHFTIIGILLISSAYYLNYRQNKSMDKKVA
jgi:TRAP transporter 4TM/12TM fusion protein